MKHKLSLLTVSILLWATSCSYLPERVTYNSNLTIRETANYIELNPKDTLNASLSGVMFYPGGLVDPHAYIEILTPLATISKRKVVIVKVESNLAVFNPQKASRMIEDFYEIKRWVLGGHSLGGAMACINIYKKSTDFKGLFLLAAYSNKNISSTQIPIISITASNDKVLNWESFSEYKTNLSSADTISSPMGIPVAGSAGKTLYYTIDGGVHYQFGSYGVQKGDGIPTISKEEQHRRVYEVLEAYLLNNEL